MDPESELADPGDGMLCTRAGPLRPVLVRFGVRTAVDGDPGVLVAVGLLGVGCQLRTWSSARTHAQARARVARTRIC